MAFEWVRTTLQSIVAGGLPEYGGAIAWKNKAFNPQNKILWLKIIYVPVTEDVVTLGDEGDNELAGFLQIGVYQKAGTGVEEAEQALAKLNSLLKIPQRLPAPTGCLLRLHLSQADKVARRPLLIQQQAVLKVFGMQVI